MFIKTKGKIVTPSKLKGNSKKKSSTESNSENLTQEQDAMANGSDFQEAALNQLDILKDENQHLKRLLQQYENNKGSIGFSELKSDVFSLVESAKKELRDCKMSLSNKESELENERQNAKIELENLNKQKEEQMFQFQFIIEQNERELEEKNQIVREMENEIIVLNSQIDGYLITPEYELEEPIDDYQEVYKELKAKIRLLSAQIKRKNDLLEESNKTILKSHSKDNTKYSDSEKDNQSSKKKLEETEKLYYAAKSECELLQDKYNEKNQLSIQQEYTISSLKDSVALLELKLKKQVNNENNSVNDEITKKDGTIWDLRSQLLEQDQYTKNLESQIRRLKDVESIWEKQNETEKLIHAEAKYSKLVKENELKKHEISTLKLQISEQKLEIQRYESEKQNLKLTSSNLTRPISLTRNIMVPLRTEGLNDNDHTKIELQLKDAALQKLSIKNEELIQQIDTLSKATLVNEDSILKDEEINILHQRLTIANSKADALEKEKEKLADELKTNKANNTLLQKEADSLRESYLASQKYFGEVSKRFKEESDAYAEMIGTSFNDIDRLQGELNKERKKSIQSLESYKMSDMNQTSNYSDTHSDTLTHPNQTEAKDTHKHKVDTQTLPYEKSVIFHKNGQFGPIKSYSYQEPETHSNHSSSHIRAKTPTNKRIPTSIHKRSHTPSNRSLSQAPTQHSEPPIQPTQAPIQHPQAPTQHAQAPTQYTQAPTQHPQALTPHTQAPTQSQQALTQHAQAPTPLNQAPTQHTQVPTQHPQAAAQFLQSPIHQTQVPTQFIKAPMHQTLTPTLFNQAPTQHTHTQEPTQPTLHAHPKLNKPTLQAQIITQSLAQNPTNSATNPISPHLLKLPLKLKESSYTQKHYYPPGSQEQIKTLNSPKQMEHPNVSFSRLRMTQGYRPMKKPTLSYTQSPNLQ